MRLFVLCLFQNYDIKLCFLRFTFIFLLFVRIKPFTVFREVYKTVFFFMAKISSRAQIRIRWMISVISPTNEEGVLCVQLEKLFTKISSNTSVLCKGVKSN